MVAPDRLAGLQQHAVLHQLTAWHLLSLWWLSGPIVLTSPLLAGSPAAATPDCAHQTVALRACAACCAADCSACRTSPPTRGGLVQLQHLLWCLARQLTLLPPRQQQRCWCGCKMPHQQGTRQQQECRGCLRHHPVLRQVPTRTMSGLAQPVWGTRAAGVCVRGGS